MWRKTCLIINMLFNSVLPMKLHRTCALYGIGNVVSLRWRLEIQWHALVRIIRGVVCVIRPVQFVVTHLECHRDRVLWNRQTETVWIHSSERVKDCLSGIGCDLQHWNRFNKSRSTNQWHGTMGYLYVYASLWAGHHRNRDGIDGFENMYFPQCNFL